MVVTIERAGMIDRARLAEVLARGQHDFGARAEYRFANPAPRNGTESAACADGELEDLIHL